MPSWACIQQRELNMQMQIETRKPDPVDDRSAFIGSVVACFVLLAVIIAADILFWPESSPHHLTQGEPAKSPIPTADPS
jgi:hypothetical protein